MKRRNSRPVHPFLFISIALLLVVGAAYAAPGDGSVVGATKIVDNGPDTERFDLVIVAEGYTEADQAAFAEHAQQLADFMLATPPFSFNCSAFNVWRIDVVSDEAGADDPVACSGSGATPATYFDATFCADGVIQRLLSVDSGTAIDVLNANVAGWDQAIVLVNSSIYGGSGGSVGVSSISGDWELIAIHEIGHAAFGLADEYEYWAGCGVDIDRDNHPLVEPAEPNVTTETDPALLKWADLIAAATAIPTTENADCTMCDGQPNPFPGDTVVGLYEGAHYYHCDAYRPVFHCMMRNFAPFCPVCTQRILDTLAPFQPANTAPVCDANGPYLAECAGLSTSVALDGGASSDVDCDVLTFEWSGAFAGGTAEGETPTVEFAGLGTFDVELVVSDGEAEAGCSSQVTVEDTIPPTLLAPPDVTMECASQDGTPVDLGEPTVDDVCDADVEVANDAPALFPLGATVVTWTATDDSGNVSTAEQLVTVVDTTPPELSVSLSPDELWPPNHRLIDVTATIDVFDICDADPDVRLVSITSNEPINGPGDGNTEPDWDEADFGTDDRHFRLRTERAGVGDGRVYTVTYVAEDDSGNATEAHDTVEAPHDQGQGHGQGQSQGQGHN